nr:hypothetical protein [Tanacetum cinerariifolium]
MEILPESTSNNSAETSLSNLSSSKAYVEGRLLASFQDLEHEGGDTRSQGGIKDNDIKIKIQDHNMQMISQINSPEQGFKIQERAMVAGLCWGEWECDCRSGRVGQELRRWELQVGEKEGVCTVSV